MKTKKVLKQIRKSLIKLENKCLDISCNVTTLDTNVKQGLREGMVTRGNVNEVFRRVTELMAFVADSTIIKKGAKLHSGK